MDGGSDGAGVCLGAAGITAACGGRGCGLGMGMGGRVGGRGVGSGGSFPVVTC